jgi:hypothetical protein
MPPIGRKAWPWRPADGGAAVEVRHHPLGEADADEGDHMRRPLHDPAGPEHFPLFLSSHGSTSVYCASI